MYCLENKWTDRQVDKHADGKRDILEMNRQTKKGTYRKWKDRQMNRQRKEHIGNEETKNGQTEKGTYRR